MYADSSESGADATPLSPGMIGYAALRLKQIDGRLEQRPPGLGRRFDPITLVLITRAGL